MNASTPPENADADADVARADPAARSNILLLTCMDLRLVDETVAFMNQVGMTDRYDHVILAGASLGAVYEGNPHWVQTFWDHLELARELHDVRAVWILDHRQCGAYQKLLGLAFGDDAREAEDRAHAEVARRLQARIQERYPELQVRRLLMDLAGAVIEI